MWKHFLLILFIAPTASSATSIFGRRVYAASGKTYEEIWSLDESSRRLAALTKSERRHAQPTCSPDGARIWFVSGGFGDESNRELWSFDPRTRTETMAVAFNGSIIRLLGGTESHAFFTAFEGEQLGLYRWDGKISKLSSLSVAVENPAALSPDAKTLAAQNAEGVLTMMDSAGARGQTVGACSGPVWSPDGTRIACVNGRTIRIVNLTTGIPAGHWEFSGRATAPAIADYSRDGARLIVGTVGANHNSTSPQSDYWVLEMGSGKWSFVGPGQSAIFAAGDEVLLTTPRDLNKIGKGHDWVAQLLLVNPATHAQTPVAGGNASNVEPCRCGAGGAVKTAISKEGATPAGLVSLGRQRR